MPYTKYHDPWQNDAAGGDPIDAAALDHIESGIATAQSAAESAQTAANNAQTAANSAQTSANTAESDAQAAQTKANDAYNLASTAEQTAHKGVASGYASLDGSAKVPLAQIPALPESQVTNLTTDLAATEKTANKGVANGYASLDANTHVPLAQIPALPESQVTNLTTDLAATEKTANKGVANGYASLDATTKVPVAQIPALPESQVTNLTSDLAAKINSSSYGVASGTAQLGPDAMLPSRHQTKLGDLTRLRLESGPVCLYKLSEFSGGTAAFDELTPSHSGTYSGTPTFQQPSPDARCSFEYSVLFNGTTDFLTLPVPMATMPTNNFCAAITFYWTAAANQYAALQRFVGGANDYGLFISNGSGASGNHLSILVNGLGWMDLGVTVSPNGWYDVIWGRSAGQWFAIVNGQYITNVAWTYLPTAANTAYTVAGEGGATNLFQGRVAQAAFYDRVLTASEAKEQANCLSAAAAAGLTIAKAGVVVATEQEINLIAGTNMTVTVADDPANGKVDVTLAAAGGGGGGSTLEQLIAALSPDLWWKLNDGGATIADSSGHAHNGTQAGTIAEWQSSLATCPDPCLWMSNDAGAAATTYIDAGNVCDYAGTASFSVLLFWMPTDITTAPGTYRVLANKFDTNTNTSGWGLLYYPSNHLIQFARSAAVASGVNAGGLIMTNQVPVMILGVYDGVAGTMSLYVNGLLWNTVSGQTGSMAARTTPLRLNAHSTGWTSFAEAGGFYQHFACFPSALSSTDAANLYKAFMMGTA